jgi:hypothetical protein
MTQTLSTPAEFIDFLADLNRQLIDIVSLENDMLRQNNFKALPPVQVEKNRISAAYETQIKILGDNPMLAQNWDPSRKEHLRTLAVAFDKVARENVILLQAARHVNMRVLEAIRDAAIEQKKEHQGYGNLAYGPGLKTGKTRDQALSVTLDQRL